MGDKQYYSGICLCGHDYHTHHVSMCNLKHFNETGENSIAGECLAYGANEFYTGDDNDGNFHCSGFIDKDDINKNRIDNWRGTKK